MKKVQEKRADLNRKLKDLKDQFHTLMAETQKLEREAESLESSGVRVRRGVSAF